MAVYYVSWSNSRGKHNNNKKKKKKKKKQTTRKRTHKAGETSQQHDTEFAAVFDGVFTGDGTDIAS